MTPLTVDPVKPHLFVNYSLSDNRQPFKPGIRRLSAMQLQHTVLWLFSLVLNEK